MTINLKIFRKDKSMRPGLEVRTQVQVGSKAEEICKDYCMPYSFIPPMQAQCEAACKLTASEFEKSSNYPG